MRADAIRTCSTATRSGTSAAVTRNPQIPWMYAITIKPQIPWMYVIVNRASGMRAATGTAHAPARCTRAGSKIA